MNYKIFLLVFSFSFISFLSFSQEKISRGTKYTVTANLKKDYDNDCNCQSLLISNKMFDFRIIDMDMEDYFLKNINIIIPCPESYGDNFFKKDTIYKIEFYDDCYDKKDGWVCDYDISKRKKMRRRFWVHSIVKVE